MQAAIPLWVTALIVASAFLAMSAWEAARPLRRRVEPRARHVGRNLATAGVSLAVVSALQAPILLPLAHWVAEHHVGLLQQVSLLPALRLALGVLLLDYTLWFWHRWSHTVPFLWRFHLVHHVDRDLDASTALRFHFGELALSIPYRALQVFAIGVDPFTLGAWQALVFVSILFHHSNTRLPIRLERLLVRLVVTPRMHGIHHSDVRNETNSNWSNLFTVWDYLHRTALLNVEQRSLSIGVPAYRAEEQVTLPRILSMPFRREEDAWARGAGGRRGGDEPDRPHDSSGKRMLSA